MIGTCLAAAVLLLWGLYRRPYVETKRELAQPIHAEPLPVQHGKQAP
jgi:hypothetical protein